MAWPFLEAVDAHKVPDYYQVVTEPMGECHMCYILSMYVLCLFHSNFCYIFLHNVADLATLSKKLKSNKYTTIGDFAKDATKIFNNARYYNAKDTPIFVCAEKLEKYFVHQLKDIKVQTDSKKS